MSTKNKRLVVIRKFVSRQLSGNLFLPYCQALLCREKPMARGIPLVIIGSIGRIHLGAGANDCLGFQGAEALRHRWNWNKWGRNKLLDNDTKNKRLVVIRKFVSRQLSGNLFLPNSPRAIIRPKEQTTMKFKRFERNRHRSNHIYRGRNTIGELIHP